MGKSQKWITCLPPASLVEKYSDEDSTENSESGMMRKHAFAQGDPYEERAVVLDEDTLPFAQSKVTIGPHGIALRQFFLEEVQKTMVQSVVDREPVLILLFSHGDWGSK